MYALIIIAILVLLYWSSRVKVRVGHHEWDMARYSNAREAAELLNEAHSRLIHLMRALRKKYGGSARSELHRIANHLLENYDCDRIIENNPWLSTNTSYTVNKGTMYICLRHRNNPNKLVDINTLMFVVLHEVSHIANYKGWHHTPDYWKVFKFILHEAVLAGVYTPINYFKQPVNYCGLTIDSNPLFSTTPSIWAGQA